MKSFIVMTGTIDCIMHDPFKKVLPSSKTRKLKRFLPHGIDSDVPYSVIWIVLDGSDSENPRWLEIERPMMKSYEWKGDEEIKSGKRVKVRMELL